MTSFADARRVEYADTDMAGIVHFTAFFRYMETAEHALFRSLGLSINQREGDRTIGWPRVSCGFDFRAPLRFGDEIVVRISLTRISRRSVSYRAEVVRGNDVVAVGRSTSACCELAADGQVKPIDIPENIKSKLSAYLVEEEEESA